ncbi:CENP-C-C domain-containing protein [Favolaschia claudopus]|uniref:CENP-C homolog n=1 Tax=Favolaschia claudopus TaxID=2862362 RepID=A0AAW0CFD3_9AGAR
MPPRKSSVGAARRTKSHVPYRGDDPTVGRKTGITVQHVPLGSDGFEPFDQLMQANDAPIPRKKARKSLPNRQDDDEDEDEDDEDGEMSMDVDSPIQNFSNTRPPNTPRTARAISRTSEVDFDQVPSPRSPSSARRRATAGPSRLTTQQLLNDGFEDGGGGGGDDYNDYSGAPDDSPRRMSFTEMDSRDDDEEEEDEPAPPTPKKVPDEDEEPTPKKSVSPKRKARAAPEPEPEPEPEEDNDSGMEEDIADGMEDVEMDPPDDNEQESDPPAPPPPKKKSVKANAIVMSRRQKENREVPEGVRRSSRNPYPPLEWWRNEKVEFGGRDPGGGPILVPRIKAIIRIPKEPAVPLSKKGRTARKRSRTPAAPKDVKIVEKIVKEVENPEAGWDDETQTQVVVKGYPSGREEERRIAFTARMFEPVAAQNNAGWLFQKIFGDGDFIAAGQILIPPKGRKPGKPSKDNTFIFLVIEGAVNLKVHETSLIVASGGMFMIPRGNTYFIENTADRNAKLFFTQARKMREGEVDVDDDLGGGGAAVAGPARAASVAVRGTAAAREPDVRRGMSSLV